MSDSVLQKYTTRRSEDAGETMAGESEELDDFGAFGWLRGVRDRALMLELRKKSGDILAVGYAWLEKCEFEPSTGITLHVVGQTIRIVGRNLNSEWRPNTRLFQGITRHRVPWIQEADEPMAMTAETSAVLIERIEWG